MWVGEDGVQFKTCCILGSSGRFLTGHSKGRTGTQVRAGWEVHTENPLGMRVTGLRGYLLTWSPLTPGAPWLEVFFETIRFFCNPVLHFTY